MRSTKQIKAHQQEEIGTCSKKNIFLCEYVFVHTNKLVSQVNTACCSFPVFVLQASGFLQDVI